MSTIRAGEPRRLLPFQRRADGGDPLASQQPQRPDRPSSTPMRRRPGYYVSATCSCITRKAIPSVASRPTSSSSATGPDCPSGTSTRSGKRRPRPRLRDRVDLAENGKRTSPGNISSTATCSGYASTSSSIRTGLLEALAPGVPTGQRGISADRINRGSPDERSRRPPVRARRPPIECVRPHHRPQAIRPSRRRPRGARPVVAEAAGPSGGMTRADAEAARLCAEAEIEQFRRELEAMRRAQGGMT